MKNYHRISKLLEDIRDGDNLSADQLLVKPSFFYYVDKKYVKNVVNNGLVTPETMLQMPNLNHELVQRMFSNMLQDEILKKCVPVFMCRVPETLDTTKNYVKNNIPIKISIDKLNKSDSKYHVYLINLPGQTKLRKIKTDSLSKLAQMEDKWYKFFENSKNPYFQDVPQAAIYCEDGKIPAFACKVLDI